MAQTVKNLLATQEMQIQSLSQEGPLEKGTPTHSSVLPGEFHGQRSLAGYSPWGSQTAGNDCVTNTFTLSQLGVFSLPVLNNTPVGCMYSRLCRDL